MKFIRQGINIIARLARRCVPNCFCRVRIFATPWTVGSSVHGIFQARILQYLPFPVPGDLPDPGIKPTSLGPPALTGIFFTTEKLMEDL